MQRGIGLLALCFTVGFGLSIVFAEDSFFDELQTQAEPNLQTIQYFSRGSKPGTESAASKPQDFQTNAQEPEAYQPFVTPLPTRYERMKRSASQAVQTEQQKMKQSAGQLSKQYPWLKEEANATQSKIQQYKRSTPPLPTFTAETDEKPANLNAFVPQMPEQKSELKSAATVNSETKLKPFTDWNPNLRPLVSSETHQGAQIQTAAHEKATGISKPERKPSPLELILAEYEELESDKNKQDIQQTGTAEYNSTPFTVTTSKAAARTLPQSFKTELINEPIKTVAYEKPVAAPESVPGPTITQLGKNSGLPQIALEWVKRSTINVGQECQFDLVITNRGEHDARQLIVEAYFPASVQLLKTEPKPVAAQGHLVWNIASIPVGSDKAIKIHMIPNQRGTIETSAIVRFSGSTTGQFTVEQPMLKLFVKGPKEVLLGDPATQLVTISNPGTGTAHNVRLNALLPSGLEHPAGKKVQITVGSINPGESRQIRIALAATGGGDQQLQLQAQADHGLSSRIQAAVSVIAPSLKIELAGPSLRYIGRTAKYRLNVTNNGTAPSNNVRVAHILPGGFRFVKADQSGNYNAANKTVGWYVGRLDAGQTKTLNLALEAIELGDYKHVAETYSEHGSRSKAELTTRIDGTASLVLKLSDLNDPIEVGSETSYEIRIRNEGSKADAQVGISCELPEGVELISAKGPAESFSENGYVIFKSLKQLPAGKTAIYRITVRGRQPGNQRFRVRLASESIKEPLVYEELTKFYSDKF